jgi:hypothetical protein
MECCFYKKLKIQALIKLRAQIQHFRISKYCLIGNHFQGNTFRIYQTILLLLTLAFFHYQAHAQNTPQRMPPQFPLGHTRYPPGIEPPPSPQEVPSHHPSNPEPPSSETPSQQQPDPLPNSSPNAPMPPEETIPQSYTADRYESLWKRSPFTLPSAVVETPVKVAGLEQKFILQSVSIIEGKPIVTLHSKDKQTSITITEEPLEEENGLRVVAIDDAKVTEGDVDDVTKLIVKIANNNEQGEISFDPAQLAQQSGLQGGMQLGMPGIPGMPGNNMPSASVPASIPAIPPPSSENSTSLAPAAPTPPPASSQQRRRMVIPSTPPPSDNSNP